LKILFCHVGESIKEVLPNLLGVKMSWCRDIIWVIIARVQS